MWFPFVVINVDGDDSPLSCVYVTWSVESLPQLHGLFICGAPEAGVGGGVPDSSESSAGWDWMRSQRFILFLALPLFTQVTLS